MGMDAPSAVWVCLLVSENRLLHTLYQPLELVIKIGGVFNSPLRFTHGKYQRKCDGMMFLHTGAPRTCLVAR